MLKNSQRLRRKASILVVVLFIVFFLSILALNAGYYAQLNIKLTNRYLERFKSFFIARGVVALVIEELERDKASSSFDSLDEAWTLKFVDEASSRSLSFIDSNGLKAGVYRVAIRDEESKININQADFEILNKFLVNFMNPIESANTAKEIVALRQSKKEAKKFCSIYELLQIDKISEGIFFGEDTNDNGFLDTWEDDGDSNLPVDDQDGELDLGLKDFITIYTGGKVNINTASLPVLSSLPGIDKDTAKSLIDLRLSRPFEALSELKNIQSLSEKAFVDISKTGTVVSHFFKIAIEAKADSSQAYRHIVVLVDRASASPLLRYWRQD